MSVLSAGLDINYFQRTSLPRLSTDDERSAYQTLISGRTDESGALDSLTHEHPLLRGSCTLKDFI